jgi:hypothetical protein
MISPHSTQPEKLPRRLRQRTADIDQHIAPLIRELWRLGFATTHCCQGDMDVDETGAPYADGRSSGRAAYISFTSWVQAALFASLAGPPSWHSTFHDNTSQRRHRDVPIAPQPWRYHWRLEGHRVRFPSRDIPRATAALRGYHWRLADLAGGLAQPPSDPGIPPPPTRARPMCGGMVLSCRKDARYCSRKCQLAGRDRRR